MHGDGPPVAGSRVLARGASNVIKRRKRRGVVVVACLAASLAAVASAAGALDPSTYRLKTVDIPMANPDAKDPTLSCPRGKRVVPAGAFFHQPGQGPDSSLSLGAAVTGVPVAGDRHWYASASNSGQDLSLKLTALCAPKRQLRGLRLKTKEFTIDNSVTGGGEVKCPSRMRLLNGGAVWHQPGQDPDPSLGAMVRTESSAPATDDRGWFADGYNYSTVQLQLRVVAACVPKRRVGRVRAKKEDLPAGAGLSAGDLLQCPSGKRVLTGGALFHRLGQAPDPTMAYGSKISSSSPTRDAKAWYADGHDFYGFPDEQLRIVVLCVPK
jgi:hypothetical protein